MPKQKPLFNVRIVNGKMRRDTPLPLMEIIGNEIFFGEFHDNTYEVYEYCLERGKTWREALKAAQYEPGKLY